MNKESHRKKQAKKNRKSNKIYFVAKRPVPKVYRKDEEICN